MDVFSGTFLPAAAAAGVGVPTVNRHLRIFRNCVAADDAAALVARCLRPDRQTQGEFTLLLTYHRLVVTQETRVLHRLRLHLNAELGHLSNVTWSLDPRISAVELAATAIDGVRERFWIRVDHPKQVRHLDALLTQIFRPRMQRATARVPSATRDVLRRNTGSWQTLGRTRDLNAAPSF
ncbi:MAG TPA: hypothetical protein VI011_20890 [Asanoa sp.]